MLAIGIHDPSQLTQRRLTSQALHTCTLLIQVEYYLSAYIHTHTHTSSYCELESYALFLTTMLICFTLPQMLIVRDWFLLTVLSIGFELLEYTLQVHLPNFGECWWDHVRSHDYSERNSGKFVFRFDL